MSEKLNFKAAYNELQGISTELDDTDIDLDILVEKVKRASYLIQLCKSELKTAESEIGTIINDVSSIVEETPIANTESKATTVPVEDLPF